MSNVVKEDILWEDGRPNMGGAQTQWHYGFAREVKYWPEIPAWDVAASYDALVTCTTAIVMKMDKQCYEGYLTMDTGEIKSMGVGEFDGKSFEHTFELFIPGSMAKALGFAQWINNSNLVFFPKNAEGDTYIIGNKAFPAKVDTTEIATGKATKDRKGWKLIVRSRGIGPAPLYTFDVPITPAVS